MWIGVLFVPFEAVTVSIVRVLSGDSADDSSMYMDLCNEHPIKGKKKEVEISVYFYKKSKCGQDVSHVTDFLDYLPIVNE